MFPYSVTEDLIYFKQKIAKNLSIPMGKNRTFNLKALKGADPLNCKRLLNSYSFMSMLNPYKTETVLKICFPVTEEPDNFLAQGCILFIQEII